MLVSALSTESVPLFLDLRPDWRVLAFTAGMAIVTCILFGLMPAIMAARTAPGDVVKADRVVADHFQLRSGSIHNPGVDLVRQQAVRRGMTPVGCRAFSASSASLTCKFLASAKES